MRFSTMREIKKMFACEHVKVVDGLLHVEYYDAHTGKRMSKAKAMRILDGDY
ncbi:MAG: hypothetical protein NTW78_03985 [Campylobacterales bacterium]|nr:hypothetical protein [Campylobacterales bacterium]